MSYRPLILISNDDGVGVQGLEVLTALMCQLGEVVVVAPDGPRSAASCCISPLTTITIKLLQEQPGLKVYRCSGTPTDCVKLALDGLLERRPDLVVSGINHGDNASVSVHYSGTVGAAFEACMKAVPAIAYSLKTKSQQCDFRPYEAEVVRIARNVLENGLPEDVLLNVNFPVVAQLKGTRFCRTSRGRWMKEMMQVGEDQYRLTGYFQNLEPDATDTDLWALDNGYASITPIQLDMTDYKQLEVLQGQGARGKEQEKTFCLGNPPAPCSSPFAPNKKEQ